MATTDRGGLQRRQDSSAALTRASAAQLARTGPAPQKHLDERTSDIRDSIDLARRQISESLDDIQGSLEQTLDWRVWVEQHPREIVGIGFALGFYLGVR